MTCLHADDAGLGHGKALPEGRQVSAVPRLGVVGAQLRTD